MNKLAPVSKYLYALATFLFGVQHFLYAAYVATLIPSWIPFHLFWVYFTGVGMVAAAVSIVINREVKIACVLLGVMMWIFILMVDFNILLQTHFGPGNITNTGKDICIASCAFLIAAGAGKTTMPLEQAP